MLKSHCINNDKLKKKKNMQLTGQEPILYIEYMDFKSTVPSTRLRSSMQIIKNICYMQQVVNRE